MEFVDDSEFTELRELMVVLEDVGKGLGEEDVIELSVTKDEGVAKEAVPPGEGVIVTRELTLIEPRLEGDSENDGIGELLGLCETVEELE